jgi:hypothetical protein
LTRARILKHGREAVGLHVPDRRGQLVEEKLHPQLGGLVLDDEQHLVVVRRARTLRREQPRELEVAAVRGFGGKLGGSSRDRPSAWGSI